MGCAYGQFVLLLATASGDRVWVRPAETVDARSPAGVPTGRGFFVALLAPQQLTRCLCGIRSGWGLVTSVCTHGAVVWCAGAEEVKRERQNVLQSQACQASAYFASWVVCAV
jgi:hypothetical protein